MDYHKTVSIIFDYFNYKLFRNANKKLNLTDRNRKMIDNFINRLSKHYPAASIGTNFLLDYFSFTFDYWSDKEGLKRDLTLEWIIGKKAILRFLEKRDSYQYFYNKFLLEYDINLDQLRLKITEEEQIDAGLDPAEELEKRRFSGEARLYNCLQHTTLYNIKSGTCLACPDKYTCKNLLRVKFPRTYEKRGYK